MSYTKEMPVLNAEHHDHDHHHNESEKENTLLKKPVIHKKLNGKKLFVSKQLSCTSSRVYVKHYEDYMVAHGCEVITNPKEADLLLVDTCAYNKKAEEESINKIKENKKSAKFDAKVIVCGCLAAINPKRLDEEYKGAYFSPKNEKNLSLILGLDEEEEKFNTATNPLVRGRFMGSDDYSRSDWYNKLMLNGIAFFHAINNGLNIEKMPFIGGFISSTQAANPKAYAITISQGCLGNCSFCVIPKAKGKTQSVPLSLIIEKIKELTQQGVKKIILASEDTGAYGKDIGCTVVDLLKKINDIPGKFDIYIHFFDPRWLRSYGDDLMEVFEKGKIKFIQLPLQSGSNQVLNRMRRAYQIEHVVPFIETYKKRFPKLTIATQFIAGFPGETKEEFEATHSILKKRLFDYVEVFNFSNRPGAECERMEDHLSNEIISERSKILRKDFIKRKLLPF